MLIIVDPKSFKPIYLLDAIGITVSEDVKFSNESLDKSQNLENAFLVYVPSIDKNFRFVSRNAQEKANWINDFKIVETKNKYHSAIDRTNAGKVKPKWIPDVLCKMCCLCESEFTTVNRKHHCRACGYIFCSACTKKEVNLPFYNGIHGKKQRVCDTCQEIIEPN